MSDIDDFINNIMSQNFTAAERSFSDLMSNKIDDAIEQEKVAVAGQIFNGEEPEDEDDISDEDFEEFEEDDFEDEEDE